MGQWYPSCHESTTRAFTPGPSHSPTSGASQRSPITTGGGIDLRDPESSQQPDRNRNSNGHATRRDRCPLENSGEGHAEKKQTFFSLLVDKLQVPVAVGVVHAGHGRPELPALLHPGRGEGGLLPRVLVGPLGRTDLILRVRRVLERVVIDVPLARGDLVDLLLDQDHR